MWINRALIFLVVSCPCALVVSVPLSFFGGIGGASREGILIKGANYLETLSKVDTVVFDKTGTLTKGTFAVNAIHPQNMTEAQLLDIAAAAESYSTHPVGESIVAAHKGQKPAVERLFRRDFSNAGGAAGRVLHAGRGLRRRGAVAGHRAVRFDDGGRLCPGAGAFPQRTRCAVGRGAAHACDILRRVFGRVLVCPARSAHFYAAGAVIRAAAADDP